MRERSRRGPLEPTVAIWVAVGLVGFVLLPWYGLESGFFSFSWLVEGYPLGDDVAPALFLGLQGRKVWLMPLGLLLLVARRRRSAGPARR